MEHSVVIAGFGGQGVILAGKILAQAGMDYGLNVTWLPSYGPEMRGGTANCTVVLADEPVGSPIVDEPSALVALNRPSLDKFESSVEADGAIIANTSLIDREVHRDDVRAYYACFNDLAREIGNPKAINMIALGAYIRATNIVSLEVVQRSMATMLEASGKGAFVAMNAEALQKGYDAVT